MYDVVRIQIIFMKKYSQRLHTTKHIPCCLPLEKAVALSTTAFVKHLREGELPGR